MVGDEEAGGPDRLQRGGGVAYERKRGLEAPRRVRGGGVEAAEERLRWRVGVDIDAAHAKIDAHRFALSREECEQRFVDIECDDPLGTEEREGERDSVVVAEQEEAPPGAARVDHRLRAADGRVGVDGELSVIEVDTRARGEPSGERVAHVHWHVGLGRHERAIARRGHVEQPRQEGAGVVVVVGRRGWQHHIERFATSGAPGREGLRRRQRLVAGVQRVGRE